MSIHILVDTYCKSKAYVQHVLQISQVCWNNGMNPDLCSIEHNNSRFLTQFVLPNSCACLVFKLIDMQATVQTTISGKQWDIESISKVSTMRVRNCGASCRYWNEKFSRLTYELLKGLGHKPSEKKAPLPEATWTGSRWEGALSLPRSLRGENEYPHMLLVLVLMENRFDGT